MKSQTGGKKTQRILSLKQRKETSRKKGMGSVSPRKKMDKVLVIGRWGFNDS